MKRKISVILFLIVFTTSMLYSCSFFDRVKPGPGTVGGDGQTEEKDPENLIFNEASELYIIADPALDNELVLKIADKVDSFRTEASKFAAVNSDPHKHEIVIGNTERPISQTAKDRLERIDKNTEDEKSFLIYSNGSSVAIVWEEDEDDALRDLAIEYFCENYAEAELIAQSGVLHSKTVNLYDYYTEKDETYKAPLWELFEEKYGSALTEAYKRLYAIYSDKCIVWLANLYDSDICVCVDLYGEDECSHTKYCGTGGFYYSNSARDNMGYLPDAESTNQALNFLAATGLASQRDGTYLSVITEEMKKSIGDFIYALEEPNGYFYHPQWGIAFTDTKISRRARDLTWSENILTALGRTPKYTTASGMKGEDVLGTSFSLTERLGTAKVLAVSKVILAADDSYAAHLQDVDSLLSYLNNGLNRGKYIEEDSYTVGNELVAQTPQIIARDKEIGTQSDPTPLMDALVNWLNSKQNPKTGTWDFKERGDEGYQDYLGTNGLFKITGIYRDHGVVMPHSKEAALSAMADITNEAPIQNVVDLYNTWSCVNNIIDNLRRYGGTSGNTQADEILTLLRQRAPEAIDVSRSKIADFLKDDGSASYTKLYSPAYSQGCPAAVPNTVEGDVNGSTLAIHGIITYSTLALEIENYKVPMFGEAARYLFRREIANLSPVTKNESSVTVEPIGFEYDDIGTESTELQINHNGGQGTAFVVADPTNSGKGNVTEIISPMGVGDSIRVPCQNTNAARLNTLVFEGDFYIENVSSAYPLQITLGSCYMVTVKVTDGKLGLWEASSGSIKLSMDEYLGVDIEEGKWFKIKVEYYPGDDGSVRIKFYCDNDLSDGENMTLYAVSDNYYDSLGDKVIKGTGTPSSSFPSTNIYVMSSDEAHIYIDNVSSYRSDTPYSEIIDPNNQPYFNVDAPSKDRVIYDFDNGVLPEDIKVSADENAVSVTDGSLLLNGTSASSVTVPVTVREKGARCGLVSLGVYCESATVGDEIMTLSGMDGSLPIFGFKVIAFEDADGKYLSLKPYGVSEGEVISDLKIPVGEEVTLSFEYYHREDIILVYLNGEFAGSSTQLHDGANRYTMDSFEVKTTAGKSFSLSLDNIIVEKKAGSFEDAVAPDIPEKTYDFSKADSDIITSGSGTKIAGGVLQMNVTSSIKNSFTVSANDRSDVSNSVILKFDINYTKTASSGTTHILKLTDKDGNVILSFELVANGNNVDIYEVGRGGRLVNPIYTVDSSKALSLKLEVFTSKKIIHIYNGQAIVAKSSIFAGEEFIEVGVEKFIFESADAKTNITVDNLKFETLYSIYKDPELSAKNPETDVASGLTFEKSSTGSIPSSIRLKLFGTNRITVENAVNDCLKAYSNILVFNKDSDGNDEITINNGSVDRTASCVVFESDLMLDITSAGAAFRLTLGEDKRANTAYFLNIGNYGGKIQLQDVSTTGSGRTSTTTNTDIAIGEWFKLRVEYYKGTKDNVRIRVLINGEVIAVSDNYARTSDSDAPKSNITSACLYYMGSTRGTICMDNISISANNQTCNDNVTVEKDQK